MGVAWGTLRPRPNTRAGTARLPPPAPVRPRMTPIPAPSARLISTCGGPGEVSLQALAAAVRHRHLHRNTGLDALGYGAEILELRQDAVQMLQPAGLDAESEVDPDSGDA